MNKPEVLWLENPFDLSSVTRYAIDQPLTIRQWLDGNGGETRLNYLATVCLYDGKELLRAEYDQIINAPVCFVTLPTGGNDDEGSNPIAAIAMIIVAIYAPQFAGYMAGATSGAAYMGYYAGFMMAGSALINAVLPPPGLPNSATPSTGSPTYSIGAQGNAARLGSPIPVNYGRMRINPDFAAQPYTEIDVTLPSYESQY